MLRELETKRSPEADGDRTPGTQRDAGTRPALPAITVAGAAEVAAQLERLLAQARRQRGSFSLVCVSVERIDGPQDDVDAHVEHRVRDEVAHRIQARIRATDRLLRESERDACVLLPGGSQEGANRVVERLVRALNGAYSIDGDLHSVRVRVGCATHPMHGLQSGELQRKAAERLCG